MKERVTALSIIADREESVRYAQDNLSITVATKPTPHTDQAAIDVYQAFGRVKPVMDALHEAIKTAGPQGIPSGHLYAMLMGRIDFEDYQWLIDTMVKAGGVTLINHVLKVK